MSDVRKSFRQAADSVLKQVGQLVISQSACAGPVVPSGGQARTLYTYTPPEDIHDMQIQELEASVSDYTGDEEALIHRLYDPIHPACA